MNSPRAATARPAPSLAGAGPAALGTFEFGTPALAAAQAYELLDAYHEQGGRLIDTAPTYGPDGGAFRAEPLIATWLRTTGAPGVHVISKAGLDPARPERGDMRPETILATAARSASRLGVPFILVLAGTASEPRSRSGRIWQRAQLLECSCRVAAGFCAIGQHVLPARVRNVEPVGAQVQIADRRVAHVDDAHPVADVRARP